MKYIYIATAHLFFTDCFGNANSTPIQHTFTTKENATFWLGGKEKLIEELKGTSHWTDCFPEDSNEYYVESASIVRVPFE